MYAYVAPTPEVEVKGVVTSAAASGSDSFTATTFVVAPGEVAPLGTGSDCVNVTRSFPTGLFGAADTFAVDSQTKVLGNTNLAPGDIVAGGLIAPSGDSAGTVGSTPLQVFVDLAPSSTSSSSAMTAEMTKRTERRALEMLRHEKARRDRHHEKLKTDRK